MSYYYSELSKQRLATCHQDLQKLFEDAITYMDLTIVCGFRDEAAQELAFKAGTSTLHWPDSKHNKGPARAVDVAPYVAGYGIPWEDEGAFCLMAGMVLTLAKQRDLTIVWGGRWLNLRDAGHFELAP